MTVEFTVTGLNYLLTDTRYKFIIGHSQLMSFINKNYKFGLPILFLLFFASVLLNASSLLLVTQSYAAGTKSALETGINPYGDAWSLKKSPNPAIAVSLGVPNITASIFDSYSQIPQEQIDFLAKSNAPFLYFDSLGGELQGGSYVTGSLPKFKDEISRIKAKNPQIKMIGYVVFYEGHLAAAEARAHADNPSDPEQAKFEKFFVHQKGFPETKEYRIDARPDHPEWGARLFDVTNPEYRAYIIPKMAAAMNDMGLDGVMSDHMYTDVLGMIGLKDKVPDSKVAAWSDSNVAFGQELKAAMGSKFLFGNVKRNELDYVRDSLLAPGRYDGILLEDPVGRSEQISGNPPLPAHPFYPGVETWDQTLAMLNMAQQKNKYVMFIVNTNINGVNGETLNEAAQRRYNSYYLGAYLQLYQPNQDGSLPSKQMFLHYNPSSIYEQFNSSSFFRDWDLDLGAPATASEQIAPGVFLRKFQKGFVYLNTTYNNYQVQINAELYSSTDGSQLLANSSVIPSKSGRIYVTRAVYDAWNGAASSPSPSPSVSPSPSAAPSVGEKVQVNRVLHPSGLRFWTMSQPEVALLVSQGWINEGKAYYAYSPYSSVPTDVVPMYRLKSRTDGTWFWTISQPEVNLMVNINQSHINEGVAYYVYSPYNPQPANTERIYRVYNTQTGERFWTNSLVEADFLAARGQVNEGVAFYTPIP